MTAALAPKESALKLALDYAELVERVAELQRKVTTVNFNERGGLVLVPPRHPAVIAFIKELDEMVYGPAADLKTARRRLRVASGSYQTRVSFRLANDDGEQVAFNRFVSLSAILIARAEAMHWYKVVNELERAERAKKRNERAAQLVPRYVVIDGHPVRVRSERERPSS